MRLLYLYYSKATARELDVKWDPNATSNSPNIRHYVTDGYAYVFDRLIEEGVIDEALAFMEVGKLNGHYKLNSKHTLYVMPRIDSFPGFVQPGDVIFVRAGFKWWREYLNPFHNTNWFIYYGAAVPRSNWETWHVVLHDLIEAPTIGRHHPRLPFTKPVNCTLFKARKNVKKEYDFILNSCYSIHDKKGQWKVINAAVEYQKLYNENLKIFMPGGKVKAEKTRQIQNVIDTHNLDVVSPGVIPREDLAEGINKSRMYVHIGHGEQHARSALEAMRSNLPLFIAVTKQWAPFVSNNPKVTRVYEGDTKDPVALAKALRQMLIDIKAGKFTEPAEHFSKNSHPEKTVAEFKRLFNVMKNHPKPDPKVICKEYGL